MGVDVDAEVTVGIRFNSENKAKEYLEETFSITEEDYQGCLGELEYSDNNHGLLWTELSGYSDDGGVLGKCVMESALVYKSTQLDSIWEALYGIFPEKDHDRVKPHIFARYH